MSQDLFVGFAVTSILILFVIIGYHTYIFKRYFNKKDTQTDMLISALESVNGINKSYENINNSMREIGLSVSALDKKVERGNDKIYAELNNIMQIIEQNKSDTKDHFKRLEGKIDSEVSALKKKISQIETQIK